MSRVANLLQRLARDQNGGGRIAPRILTTDGADQNPFMSERPSLPSLATRYLIFGIPALNASNRKPAKRAPPARYVRRVWFPSMPPTVRASCSRREVEKYWQRSNPTSFSTPKNSQSAKKRSDAASKVPTNLPSWSTISGGQTTSLLGDRVVSGYQRSRRCVLTSALAQESRARTPAIRPATATLVKMKMLSVLATQYQTNVDQKDSVSTCKSPHSGARRQPPAEALPSLAPGSYQNTTAPPADPQSSITPRKPV